LSKVDSSRNERQARRREREKRWLKTNGWRSWEALHTALMNDSLHLISGGASVHYAPEDRQASDTAGHG